MTDANTDKFRLNTDNVLGFGYQEYLSSIRGLAISQPGEYYKLRSALMKTIKRDAVGALYRSIFNALSLGKDADEQVIQADEGSIVLGRGVYIPQYPSQKVNDLAIRIAGVLGEELNKVVDLLMPDEFESIASKKLQVKGAANAIEFSV
jgi:hypothetical protein